MLVSVLIHACRSSPAVPNGPARMPLAPVARPGPAAYGVLSDGPLVGGPAAAMPIVTVV